MFIPETNIIIAPSSCKNVTGQQFSPKMLQNSGRPVGGTEYSWCSSVPGGTGIAVLALMVSKPVDTSIFQDALNKLQNDHAILRSRLHSNTSKSTFSFVTSPTPFIQIKSLDLSETCKILKDQLLLCPHEKITISPLQLILEHELNKNAWCNDANSSICPTTTTDMFFASVYSLPNAKWVVVLRLHVAACDRSTAVSLLRELLVLAAQGHQEKGGTGKEIASKGQVSLGIEDLIPSGKAKKSLLTRGMDMLSYSVNSLRLTNLKFMDAKSPRSSRVVRLQINKEDTEKILLVSIFT